MFLNLHLALRDLIKLWLYCRCRETRVLYISTLILHNLSHTFSPSPFPSLGLFLVYRQFCFKIFFANSSSFSIKRKKDRWLSSAYINLIFIATQQWWEIHFEFLLLLLPSPHQWLFFLYVRCAFSRFFLIFGVTQIQVGHFSITLLFYLFSRFLFLWMCNALFDITRYALWIYKIDAKREKDTWKVRIVGEFITLIFMDILIIFGYKINL